MPSRAATKAMDKGLLYIIAGVVAVLMIVVGVEIGIESKPTTGIKLSLNTKVAAERAMTR